MLWWRLRQLKSENASLRVEALEKLGNSKNERAVTALISALKDESWEVREAAVKALVRIGKPASKALVVALQDENDSVRGKAAEALGQVGDARAVEPLIATLQDENDSVRGKAAEALGQVGDARAVEPLIAALQDENDSVRGKAAEALGQVGDARVVKPLVIALQDDNSKIREAAAEALGKLGDVQAARLLVEARKWKRSGLSKEAAKLLLGFGTVAVELLVSLLQDGDWRVRRFAAHASREIKDARTVEPLVKLLQDEYYAVQEPAMQALPVQGWQPTDNAHRLLQAIVLERWIEVTSEVTLLGDLAVEQLVKVIQAHNYVEDHVERVAARTLGEIGDPRAVDPLIQVLERVTMHQYIDGGLPDIVVQALAKIGDIRAAAPIVKAKKYLSYRSTRTVDQALEAIGYDGRGVRRVFEVAQSDRDSARDAFSWLEKALKRSASAIDVEDLRWLSLFRGHSFSDAPDDITIIDSPYLRQLARQELIRRGLKA